MGWQRLVVLILKLQKWANCSSMEENAFLELTYKKENIHKETKAAHTWIAARTVPTSHEPAFLKTLV